MEVPRLYRILSVIVDRHTRNELRSCSRDDLAKNSYGLEGCQPLGKFRVVLVRLLKGFYGCNCLRAVKKSRCSQPPSIVFLVDLLGKKRDAIVIKGEDSRLLRLVDDDSLKR